MLVYMVMTLVDDEYGGREIFAGFSTREKAETFIQEHGQSTVETWYGSEKQYTIEEVTIE